MQPRLEPGRSNSQAGERTLTAETVGGLRTVGGEVSAELATPRRLGNPTAVGDNQVVYADASGTVTVLDMAGGSFGLPQVLPAR